jgi:hypothetical protein
VVQDKECLVTTGTEIYAVMTKIADSRTTSADPKIVDFGFTVDVARYVVAFTGMPALKDIQECDWIGTRDLARQVCAFKIGFLMG